LGAILFRDLDEVHRIFCEAFLISGVGVHLGLFQGIPPEDCHQLMRRRAILFVMVGELSATGLCVIGIVTVVSWLLDGHDASIWARAARPPVAAQQREPPWALHCWYDRRYGGEICDRPYRLPSVRRFYARDGS
jgi:hypothetical protein